MKPDIDRLYKIQEIADLLRTSKRTVEREIEAGRLRTIKISRRSVRVSSRQLAKYLKKIGAV